MPEFKVNIFLNFRSGAWGGGNQFLKALREELIKRNIYEHNPRKAKCILFNSHHNFKEILKFKYRNQDKIFIHRIDGPVYLIRGQDYNVDRKIFLLNKTIADGTIFQSNWSRTKNYSLGKKKNAFETVVMNASDKNIFFPPKNKSIEKNKREKWKLIAASWSNSFIKGFDLYQYLDKNLNFNQYSMKFVGNSPVSFKNIKHIKPVDSYNLAKLFRESDIYITGSKNDPCSNSLIEALTCGLPSIVMDDGGHPEILKNGGEIFRNFEECLEKIELVIENYNYYKNSIVAPEIESISDKYIHFMKKIWLLALKGKYRIKHLNTFDYWNILLFHHINQTKFGKIIYNKKYKIFLS